MRRRKNAEVKYEYIGSTGIYFNYSELTVEELSQVSIHALVAEDLPLLGNRVKFTSHD